MNRVTFANPQNILAPARGGRRRTGGVGMTAEEQPRIPQSAMSATASINSNQFWPGYACPNSLHIHGRITTLLCKRTP
jgi:hypothetical protein